jgi:hypothetical protein
MLVMGNAYPTPRNLKQYSGSSSIRHHENAEQDAGVDNSLVSLLEENARLRALVVQLSDLVLRNVVGQK